MAFIWKLKSNKYFLAMKTLKMFGMALFAVLMCVNFAACEEEEPGGIPQSFKAGTKIYFDSQSSTDGYASWGFDWFVAKSATKCQWVGSNYDGGNISEQFSSAQYEYVVTGENKATLTSVNYQSSTGRVWHVSITMNYETNSSGTYISEEFIPGGKTHFLSGVFEIK